MGQIDQERQKVALEEILRVWPYETVEQHALAVAEEAGEVVRAILKGSHVFQYQRKVKGQTLADWNENLALEIGQLLLTTLSLAERNGIDAMTQFDLALDAVRAMKSKVE